MNSRNAIKLLAMVALATTMMYGQASRTWVSGVGDDANPCSRTAPCKTFAGAISKTAAGGEIDALDPGGFGALTITKSITLDGGGGQVASVLVAGTNGIVVAAQPTDVVIIRNLRLDGLLGNASNSANAGLNGIRFLSGRTLIVENCVIFGFAQNGVDVALNQNTAASVHVINTVVENVAGVGIRATNAQLPAVQMGIDRAEVAGANVGIEAADHSHVAIKESLVERAATTGVLADSPSGDALLDVDHSDISFNANGITSGPGTAGVVVANCKIAYNSGTAMNQAGGNIFSYGTNRIHSNGSSGTFTTIAQQ